jgi:DnaJ-domain-containing protein 1
MTDYFALLGETRRPWLDTEALKVKFLTLTARVHPDRVHNANAAEKQAAHQLYSELNTAFNCLREPKTRLLHLFELELGSKPQEVQQISPAAAEWFSEVGELCREADSFLAEKINASSPLLRVEWFKKAMALTGRLNALLGGLSARHAALIEETKYLNLAWESAPPVGSPARIHTLPFGRLEHIYRELSYFTRWRQQVQDRVVRLSL